MLTRQPYPLLMKRLQEFQDTLLTAMGRGLQRAKERASEEEKEGTAAAVVDHAAAEHAELTFAEDSTENVGV